MKKKLTMILCLILALCLVFTGCNSAKKADDDDKQPDSGAGSATGEKNPDATQADNRPMTDEEKIVGTWEATVDLTDMLNEQIGAADASMGEYLKFDGFTMKVIMTFSKDNICTLKVDEKSIEDSMDHIKGQLKDGMTKMLEDMLKEQNMDMTVEELMATTGKTMDELIDESFDQAMSSADFSEMNHEGQYMLKDGNLYLSDSADEKVEEKEGSPYSFNGDTLVLEAGEGLDEEIAKLMFPLTLKKVG